MALKETAVRARLAELLPDRAGMDRRTRQAPTDQVDRVHEVVARALESDQDAPYHLLALAAQRLDRQAALLQEALATVDEVLPVLDAVPVQAASSRRFAAVLAISGDTAESGKDTRSRLVNKLRAEATSYAQSARMGTAPLRADVDRPQLLAKLDRALSVMTTLGPACAVLTARLGSFAETWARLDVVAKPARRQAAHAAAVLKDKQASDLQQAPASVVDAVLLAGLVQATTVRLDLVRDKWSGTVVPKTGAPATLLGSPLPWNQAQQAATVKVDDGPSDTITMPAALAPKLRLSGVSTWFGPNEVHEVAANGTGPYTPTLKSYVYVSGVTVIWVNGGVTQRLTDNGGGGWSAGAGTITYLTGVTSLTLPSAADGGTVVRFAYKFSPLSDLQHRDAAGANPVSFKGAETFDHDTLVSGTLADGVLTGPADLAGRLDAALPAVSVTHDAAVDQLLWVGTALGAGSQLMWPDRTAGVLRIATGAPTWSTPPANVNAALKALLANGGRAFGTDSQHTQVAVGAAISALVTVDVLPMLVLDGQTATVASASKDVIAVPASKVLVGDVVLVSSPVASTHRVIALPSTTAVQVSPAVPFPVGTPPTTLAASVDVTFDVRRDRLRVRSKNTSASSKLEVPAAGLDLAGTAYGGWPVYTLQTDVELAYSLRPGDVVLSNGTQVGTVKAVAGKDVTVDATQAAPLSSVAVRGKGRHLFPALRSALGAVDLAPVTAFAGLAGLAAHANVRDPRHEQQRTAALLAVGAVRTAVAAYQANRSRFVDDLLAWLREERLERVVQRLLDLDLDTVFSDDVLDMTDVGAAEALLEELMVEFDVAEPEPVRGGTDPLSVWAED